MKITAWFRPLTYRKRAKWSWRIVRFLKRNSQLWGTNVSGQNTSPPNSQQRSQNESLSFQLEKKRLPTKTPNNNRVASRVDLLKKSELIRSSLKNWFCYFLNFSRRIKMLMSMNIGMKITDKSNSFSEISAIGPPLKKMATLPFKNFHSTLVLRAKPLVLKFLWF